MEDEHTKPEPLPPCLALSTERLLATLELLGVPCDEAAGLIEVAPATLASFLERGFVPAPVLQSLAEALAIPEHVLTGLDPGLKSPRGYQLLTRRKKRQCEPRPTNRLKRRH
jgi:hypothetical protein